MKRLLLLGIKVMANLDRILKSRDITLPTKVRLVKAMVFPVVMYGWESWTIKKAEHQRIDVFDQLLFLWCWRRLLRIPWTARRANQSILKEIIPEYSLEDWCWRWNSNTLATWCEERTHWKRPCCWERLKAGGAGDDREWDGWMASPMQWTWIWVGSGSWWWAEKPGVLHSMGSERVRHNWATELNWTGLCSTSGFPVLHYTQSLLRFISIEWVMLSNHLILYYPLLLLPSIYITHFLKTNKLFGSYQNDLIRWFVATSHVTWLIIILPSVWLLW